MTNILTNNPDEDIAPITPFGAIDYETTEDELRALTKEASDVQAITDKESYAIVRKALTTLVTARTTIESKRKDLKKVALDYGKEVDGRAKELTAVIQPEEDRLREMIDAEKKRREEEQAAKEQAERARINAIQDALNRYRYLPDTMAGKGSADLRAVIATTEVWEPEESEFQEFISDARALKPSILQRLREMCAQAIAREEEDRRRAEEQKRIAEEQARIKAEQEAEAKRIAEEVEAARKEQAKRDAEFEAQRKAHEAEMQRQRDEQAAREAEIERERQELEAQKRAEQERQEEAARKEEAARLAEQQARERAERIERLKPDCEKVEAFAQTVADLVLPELSAEPESGKALEDISVAIHEAASEIERIAARLR